MRWRSGLLVCKKNDQAKAITQGLLINLDLLGREITLETILETINIHNGERPIPYELHVLTCLAHVCDTDKKMIQSSMNPDNAIDILSDSLGRISITPYRRVSSFSNQVPVATPAAAAATSVPVLEEYDETTPWQPQQYIGDRCKCGLTPILFQCNRGRKGQKTKKRGKRTNKKTRKSTRKTRSRKTKSRKSTRKW
jgi:hypothetical protein